ARYQDAAQRYEDALPIYRNIGARLGEANCVKALGDVARRQARYQDAAQRYEDALPIYRNIGARLGEANTHLSIGLLALAQGQPADEELAEAERLYREIGLTEQADLVRKIREGAG
ncbi:MAG: tetratricopeptide repeat protein, partial [Acidobacteria bacterium]|nr:tetratricopeptide repeat protein [Acidobacteriota bacterium]